VAYDEIRLTVDEPADYELLWRLYEGVDPDDRGIVPVREAIAYAVEEGHVDLNADVQQVVVDDG
jgi:spore coat polysaccharide biosynthesis protein SpsF (cytidylyltransferase family)